MKKIESILGEAYGLKIKTRKNYKYPCYIGEILNQECLEAIGAHSISKGNNLENNTWYNFQHDSDNIKNKYLMLDLKKLKSISQDNSSVEHTICLKHDSKFHIFEGDNNVEIKDTYQLNLLNIRTFINFYFKALNSNSELFLKRKLLEKYLILTKEQQDAKKLKLAIRNVKRQIKENEMIIKEKSFLEYLVNEYWNLLHKNEEIEDGFYNTSFLTEEMNFLVMPLDEEPLIVGSFLVHSKILKKYLTDSNEKLEKLICSELEYLEPEDYFNEECSYEEQEEVFKKMEGCGNDGFIVIHILNNKKKPCIIIQSYDNSESIECLFNFYTGLRDDHIRFTFFITSIIIKNSNVFYNSKLINSLSSKEKNKLTNLHNKNKKQICFSDQLIHKISKTFKFNREDVILYLKGKSYKYLRMLEKKASVKILSINLISDLSLPRVKPRTSGRG